MKEIKFRAQALTDHRWVYGNLVLQSGTMFTPDYAEILEFEGIESGEYLFNSVAVKPETIGQYTGLNDKNNREIYNRDLCSDGSTIFEVKWNQQQTSFWLSPAKSIKSDDFLLMQFENQRLGNGYLSRKDLEVIGNVHDNPEQLQSNPE